MTTKIETPGTDLIAGGVVEADVPFPTDNLLFWVDAGQVTMADQVGTVTESRVHSFTNPKTGVSYPSFITDRRCGKRLIVNGLPVIQSSLQAGVGSESNYRGYNLGNDIVSNKPALTICGVIKADPENTLIDTIYAVEPSNGSPNGLVRLEWETPTTLRVRAKRAAVSETFEVGRLSALPAEYIPFIITIDWTTGKIAMEAVGLQSKVQPAFAGNLGNCMTTSGGRNVLFRSVLPDQTSLGNLYRGQLRNLFAFGDVLTAKQRMLTRSFLFDEAKRLKV